MLRLRSGVGVGFFFVGDGGVVAGAGVGGDCVVWGEGRRRFRRGGWGRAAVVEVDGEEVEEEGEEVEENEDGGDGDVGEGRGGAA